MESTKVFFVFMGFMIAGFLLLVYNRTETHGANYSIMLGSNQTHAYIRENCIRAAQPKVAEKLYLPTETVGDGSAQVTMTWKAGLQTVTCRYEQGKGVSEVKIDGVSIGAISIDTGLDPAARVTTKHVEH